MEFMEILSHLRTFEGAVVALGVRQRFLVHFLLAHEAELLDVVDVSTVGFRHVQRAGDLRIIFLPAVQARIAVGPSLLHARSITLRDVIAEHASTAEETFAAPRALVAAFVVGGAEESQAGFLVHVDHLVFPHGCSVAEELSAN